MYYWGIVGYVKVLRRGDYLYAFVKATPSAAACLWDITPGELGFALELGGAQPLHDCMVKLVNSTIYIWHKNEAQPPIPLVEGDQTPLEGGSLPGDELYEVVEEREGLVLVLDRSSDPLELVGIAPISRELAPILWMLNSFSLMYMQSLFFKGLDEADEEPEAGESAWTDKEATKKPLLSSAPEPIHNFPHFEMLLEGGPRLNIAFLTLKDEPLAETVREWLAKRDGINLEQARDKYPYMIEVSRCAWREGLFEDPLGFEASEKAASFFLTLNSSKESSRGQEAEG